MCNSGGGDEGARGHGGRDTRNRVGVGRQGSDPRSSLFLRPVSWQVETLRAVLDFEAQGQNSTESRRGGDSDVTWFCQRCGAPRLHCLSKGRCTESTYSRPCHNCGKVRLRGDGCANKDCKLFYCDICLGDYGQHWLPLDGSKQWSCLSCDSLCNCSRCKSFRKPLPKPKSNLAPTSASLASVFLPHMAPTAGPGPTALRRSDSQSSAGTGDPSKVTAFSAAIPKFVKILKELLRNSASKPFRESVAGHGLVFRSHGNLGAVRAKLHDGGYSLGEQIVYDVRTLLNNALVYNGAGSETGRCAQELSFKFEKWVAALPGGPEWQLACPALQEFQGPVDYLVESILDKRIGEADGERNVEYLVSFLGRDVDPVWKPSRETYALSLVQVLSPSLFFFLFWMNCICCKTKDFEEAQDPPGEIPADLGQGEWVRNRALQSKRSRPLDSAACHICDGTESLAPCANLNVSKLGKAAGQSGKSNCLCVVCAECLDILYPGKGAANRPCIHCATPERCCPPPVVCSVCGDKSIRWQSCNGPCGRDVCWNCINIAFRQDCCLNTTVLVDVKKRKLWLCPPCNSKEIEDTVAAMSAKCLGRPSKKARGDDEEATKHKSTTPRPPASSAATKRGKQPANPKAPLPKGITRTGSGRVPTPNARSGPEESTDGQRSASGGGQRLRRSASVGGATTTRRDVGQGKSAK